MTFNISSYGQLWSELQKLYVLQPKSDTVMWADAGNTQCVMLTSVPATMLTGVAGSGPGPLSSGQQQ